MLLMNQDMPQWNLISLKHNFEQGKMAILRKMRLQILVSCKMICTKHRFLLAPKTASLLILFFFLPITPSLLILCITLMVFFLHLLLIRSTFFILRMVTLQHVNSQIRRLFLFELMQSCCCSKIKRETSCFTFSINVVNSF